MFTARHITNTRPVLACGNRILRYDRARERTRRQLMRLYYSAGDQTAALRQYEQCAAALGEELGVRPARSTLALHQQIRAGQFDGLAHTPVKASAALESTVATLPEVLSRLKQLEAILTDEQRQVQQEIQNIEMTLNDQC